MSFDYALTFFCDAMLYCGALGCLGLLRACRADLFCVPVILLTACWASGRLTGGGRKPWLRWLPLAAILPALWLAGNAPGRLIAIPMAAYLALYVRNNRRAPDYDYAADRFRHSLIAAGAALFLAALFRASTWQKGLPYLFAYFTLNMALLRMLRHDDRVARSGRFRVINLGGVALVCAAGFALAQPGVVAIVRAGWRWFLGNVVLNLAALMLFAVQCVLYAGAWVLGLFVRGGGDEPFQMPPIQPITGDDSAMMRATNSVKVLPPFIRYAVMGLGAALVALLTFAILRALSRRVARTTYTAGTDQRESLDAQSEPRARSLRLRRGPEDGVRQQYRRVLSQLRARGGRVAPTMNTMQILEQNAENVDTGAMAELREVYLPVRYGEKAVTKADVARARDAAKRC